ncbi:MAG: N-acetylmuramoyl-L-alanine amidase [Eubacteriales bacterium]|nr:N-acetylmuramoyl-L-alanine amidase [Eubacteriales bacterium]
MRKYRRKMELCMTLLVLICSFCIGRLGAKMKAEPEAAGSHIITETIKSCIVIDAGHGGFDSGKIGVGGILEKDINLSIARKLQKLLEAEHLEVRMTREEDEGLAGREEDRRKQKDMRQRVERINSTKPELAVSIHQNSYTDSAVCGPQVFYYGNSEEGKRMAKILQDTINSELAIPHPRREKSNMEYYLLRRTAVPTVIIECGFLSNPEEEGKLKTEEYQEQVAASICHGILKCLD